MVIWIIGLSGAGKSTLANDVARKLREKGKPVAEVDGDVIRDIFNNELGHSIGDRKKNADRICALCKYLETQDIIVVCSILSMFEESRAWNRENLKNYFEVFIDAPIHQLEDRDSKGLYSKFKQGIIKDVPGMDLQFPRPTGSDLVIQNDREISELLKYADSIASKVMGFDR